MDEIKIIETPEGPVPKHIRDAWVGLTLPIAVRGKRNVPTADHYPKNAWESIGLLFNAQRKSGYIVKSSTALDILKNAQPDAYDWWQQNNPRYLKTGQYFLFPENSCSYIQNENTTPTPFDTTDRGNAWRQIIIWSGLFLILLKCFPILKIYLEFIRTPKLYYSGELIFILLPILATLFIIRHFLTKTVKAAPTMSAIFSMLLTLIVIFNYAVPLIAVASRNLPAIFAPYEKNKQSFHPYGDPHAILIYGPIRQGLTDAVRQTLDKNPDIKIIAFDSEGGFAFEGRALGRLIRQRGIATYAKEFCASACTFAYAGGINRLSEVKTVFQFHRAVSAGENKAMSDYLTNNVDKPFLIEMGLSSQFIEKAMSIYFPRSWQPTMIEMEKGKFVTLTPKT